MSEDLKNVHSKYEAELNHIRNKKRGGAKKNKEKTQGLVNKLADLKKIKERADELNITMDYLEPGKIKPLQDATKLFKKNTEDDGPTKAILAEIETLIESSEQNRQRVLGSDPTKGAFESQRTDANNPSALANFDFSEMQDIIRKPSSISDLKMGDILDAQDYLGSWYLAIVIEDTSQTTKQIHFLPYNRSNRDEPFTKENDEARIAPAFEHAEVSVDIQ